MNIRITFGQLILSASMACVVALAESCSEGKFDAPTPSGSSFSIEAVVHDDWKDGAASRSASGEDSLATDGLKGYKLESDSAANPLYIFESVSDRINSDKSGDNLSRGSWVDGTLFNDREMVVYSYFAGRPEEPFYMADVPFVHTGGNYWTAAGPDFLWPIANKEVNDLQFFAYSLYGQTDKEKKSLISVEKNLDRIKVHYTVPDKMEDQNDLLISDVTAIDYKTATGDSHSKLNLTFRHALSSVRFEYGAHSMYPGEVTNISISNLVGEGDYDIFNNEWDTSSAELRDFSFDCKARIVENKEGENLDTFTSTGGNLLGAPGTTSTTVALMMMPQSTAGREGPAPVLTIKYKDTATGTERIFQREFNIDWKPGRSYVYSISETNMHTVYHFDVKVKGGSITDDKGNVLSSHEDDSRAVYACGNEKMSDNNRKPAVTVTSYYEVRQLDDDGNIISVGTAPARWSSELMEKTGDVLNDALTPARTSFISYKALHGEHKFAEATNSVTIPVVIGRSTTSTTTGNEIDLLNSHNQSRYLGSAAKPHDLSMEGGAMNTANCYIIECPGWYQIPLVYGNAIKNGETNTAAFRHTPGSDPDILYEFVRHDDQPIESPWICQNHLSENKFIKPEKAKLVRFQSVSGHPGDKNASGEARFSPDDFSITPDGKYLKFHINNHGPLYPGNALIAVTDADGTVLWTWHIWITGVFIENPVRSVNIGQYDIMRYSLGESMSDKTTYPQRDFYLKLTQTRENNTPITETSKIVRITQQGWECVDYPETITYQFGRMAPLYTHLYRRYVDVNGDPDIQYYHKYFEVQADVEATENEIKAPASIGTVIKSPKNIFYRVETYNGSKKWARCFSKEYKNLWNNGTTATPVKTVYDPCPPGFMVPPTNTFLDGLSNVHFISDAGDPYYYHIASDQTRFARGALINSFSIAENEPSHNNLYSPLWTSAYSVTYNGNGSLSARGIEGVSFYFETGDTHTVLNQPSLKELKAHHHSSFQTAYLGAIRPICEP